MRELRQLVKADSKPTWVFDAWQVTEWFHEGAYAWSNFTESNAFRCRPEDCCILVALEHGLYELWSENALDENLRMVMLPIIMYTLMTYCLGGRWRAPNPPPFDRLLRSLAICFADGLSVNSPLRPVGAHVPTSFWQNQVWHSIVTTKPQVSIAPVWLLFLLYGADRSFTLTLEPSCNFSTKDKCTKLIMVTSYWGPEKCQIHSPILIDEVEDSRGIMELAKSQNWSLSLKDITYLWFASYADSFRRIFELYENTADIPSESLRDLRRELGFDPECWQTQMLGDPQPFLQCRWQGTSWVLLCGDDQNYLEG
jgi:hypothetical protein